ncbi:hypothetical protein LJC45_00835 [Alistipes sp. OttesenSCG-928-B03]|nr:hypothetical protein [Alistipes sp. OttesenSCG-928-B03]
MALTRILITVKTYPTLSETYDELVCTAGFREDGSWIRIYPVPFRKLDYENQYKKWQWIEIDITKNTKDFRPESFRPTDIEKAFTVGEVIGTDDNWARRKEIVLQNVHDNMTELIAKAKANGDKTSLAILKPTEVIDFICEPCEREWDKQKLAVIEGNQAQQGLFDDSAKKLFTVVRKLPYKFSYVFTTKDGVKRTLMIEDWELGELYWKCLRKANGDETVACRKVKEKYFDYMVKKRDLHFFLGTTKVHHARNAPNPFIIIGAFYPPKVDAQQLDLF